MRRPWLGALLTTVVGCTLTTSLDGLSGGDDSPLVDEASTPIDASSDQSSASDVVVVVPVDAPFDGGNQVANGDFEVNSSCTGGGFNSTLSWLQTVPHGGKSSCRVCSNGTGADSFSIDKNIDGTTPVVGATYRTTAWVRKAQQEAAPAGGVVMNIRSFKNAPYAAIELGSSTIGANVDWTFVSVDLTITKPAEGLDVFLAAATGTNTCFVVDDLTFQRVQ